LAHSKTLTRAPKPLPVATFFESASPLALLAAGAKALASALGAIEYHQQFESQINILE
jgi:hypothetical protein